ncbi:hypothetical protein HNP84_009366 [Thermocatellispora tengchongensis]|uniref:Uncharacterized protein n=1 Tax=Thermocatellispora tengchongensis TaxID=1073253 RepID=A0A840PKH7_9ACTN|nr:hypothetical protein [Thermocatellispora tengchongensis]MBB5139602.1 hypothetical protein [Thermocatellispora tengchongensis]
MSEPVAFWVDHEYDRERAADGVSRFGDQVRSSTAEFAGAFGDIAPVAFACTAWRLATAPVLSPGYVRWHRRILSARCLRNSWDGTMMARVELVSPRPATLTWTPDWEGDREWRDWPQTFGQFLEPSEQDLVKTSYLRAMLLLQTPIPLDGLPDAPADADDDLEETARRTVILLAKKLNDAVGPIVRQLERW